ncbi:MAG: hypothetical protein RR795_08890 [Cetobacterium sp.]|uniref:hypothetical protein n=1 Tax=Cetobacterium sp. TaxID=2071632 RepID=UPI002FCB5E83
MKKKHIYKEDSKAREKPTTYELSKYIINSKILSCFKELKINEIEAIIIREWQNMLLTDDKKI